MVRYQGLKLKRRHARRFHVRLWGVDPVVNCPGGRMSRCRTDAKKWSVVNASDTAGPTCSMDYREEGFDGITSFNVVVFHGLNRSENMIRDREIHIMA